MHMHFLLLQALSGTSVFVDQLVKQSPFIGLMGLGLKILYDRSKTNEATINELRAKHDADQKEAFEKLETYLKEDREKLMELVGNNTAALHDLEDTIKEMRQAA